MWIALALFACSGDKSPVDDVSDSDSDTPEETIETDLIGDEESDPPDTDAPSVPRREQVCTRWRDIRADMREVTWTGNVQTCFAGGVDEAGKERARALVNLYRFIAGQPPVPRDPVRDAAAQQCALMMEANHKLDHEPPESWKCWSADGAEAAGASNIATAPSVESIDMYIQDWGNEASLGHRRWILGNWVGPIGVGSTGEYSCLYVGGGPDASDKPWVAWPPAGPFPIEAINPAEVVGVDDVGWSLQADEIDLATAVVTVKEGDTELPVETFVLGDWYGSKHAIRFKPDGWRSAAGKTYTVEVSGVAEPFSYQVDMIRCE